MPSVRLKIDVVGTGGGEANRPSSTLSTRSPLTNSYIRHAFVARGLPLNGVPKVMTHLTSSALPSPAGFGA
jgi:hypothetical protein